MERCESFGTLGYGSSWPNPFNSQVASVAERCSCYFFFPQPLYVRSKFFSVSERSKALCVHSSIVYEEGIIEALKVRMISAVNLLEIVAAFK